MGRGESKVSGGIVIIEPNGDVFDASMLPVDVPLTYGEKDKALTGNARDKIEEFEKAYVGADVEHIRFVTDDGQIIEENTGNSNSVTNSFFADMHSDAFSHNHPREEGVLGGTFSRQDVKSFTHPLSNVRTMRAVAKEGAYSISKDYNNPNYDKHFHSLAGAYSRACTKIRKRTYARFDSLVNDFYDKNNYMPSRHEREILNQKAFNAELCEMHNWLLDHQDRYGYTYTLERR